MRTNYAVSTRIKADDMASPIMKRIANQARLTAKSFKRLNVAAASMQRLGKLARPLERGVVGLGLAAAAAGAGAIALANRYATATDEQAKFARQVGFSTGSLERLKFIADRQGASFDTLQGGISAFTKRVGELRAGTGGLNAILKKTDPAFAELLKNTTNNEEAFELFVAKVASLPGEQAKAALAAAGVSRGAMGDLIRLTDGGAAAVAKLRAQAERFRAPLTEKDFQNAEAYKDAQTNIRFALQGVSDTIGKNLLPVMSPFIERMAEWVALNRPLLDAKLDEYGDRIGASLKGIDFDRVAKEMQRYAQGAQRVIAQGQRIVKSLGGVEGTIKKVAIAWATLRALSLAGLVARTGIQVIAFGQAIAGISTATATARVAAVADFDGIEKRHGRLSKTLGKAIVFGGIAGIGGAAALSALNRKVDKRAATIEADGVEKETARKQALDEVTREGNDAILKAIVTATDRLGILQVTDERLRARAGAAPISAPAPPPRSLDNLAAGGGLTGRGIGRLEGPRGAPRADGPRGLSAPAVRERAAIPRPVSPRRREEPLSRFAVDLRLDVNNDTSIRVTPRGTSVKRTAGAGELGVTMSEGN